MGFPFPQVYVHFLGGQTLYMCLLIDVWHGGRPSGHGKYATEGDCDVLASVSLSVYDRDVTGLPCALTVICSYSQPLLETK